MYSRRRGERLRPMTLRTIIVLTAAALIVSCPAVIPAEERIGGDHFDILYDGLNEGYARDVLADAENSLDAIAGLLGHTPGEKITITLTTSADQYRRLTNGVVPEWSAAVAIDNRTIVAAPMQGRQHTLPRIMAHEIVHIVINDAAGGTFVPRWFHEGCAQNLSGEWRIRDRLYMFWHAARGNLLSFSDIQDVFSAHRADADLAYDQSILAIGRLMSVYGKTALPAIIEGLKDGQDFPTAFYRAIGIWPSDFEKNYLAYIRKTYGIGSLYAVIPGTWTIIMIIAFVAYFVKKRRNKRLMQQWEIVEAAEKIINFEDYTGPQE